MMNKKNFSILLLTGIFLFKVAGEIYIIASRTGDILGMFSIKWGVVFVLALLFFIAIITCVFFCLWKPGSLSKTRKFILIYRKYLQRFLFFVMPVMLVVPVWFFQYSLWGMVFTGIYFRLFVWGLITLFLSVLFTEDDEKIVSFSSLLISVLFSATSFALASVFSTVKGYPFNLYWSDGNRLWDYSIMFGRARYNYPADQPINAFISPGRQFLWGIPFLLPDISIFWGRFWSAVVFSFPYMILGWMAFSTQKNKPWEIFLLALWTFLFLNQGPIYTPLVISAILVALVVNRSLWIALPFVAVAGYYAEITRWHWEFAPSIWAGMLSLNGNRLKGERIALRDWGRAFALAVAGISVWFLYPILQKAWEQNVNPVSGLGNAVVGKVAGIQHATSRQPLLWTRLLPNETYPEGIIGGLLIAILPLVIFLIFLLVKKHWLPTLWQKWVLIGSLVPFLVVGLIVSTKIGGGNNLHNLDMFLIALFFVATIAWKNGGREWFFYSDDRPLTVKILLIVLVALPALPALRSLSPNIVLGDAEIKQVQILTGSELVKSLPAESEINDAIWYIRRALDDAEKSGGEVLFIDVRQLLTFGYVQQVPLVPEYEKKRLMDEAMSSNIDYFDSYYQDLANHRFSLIISEPLKTLRKEDGSFSEEGNAWARWVATPTLCFYEPIETLDEVYVQLLVPRSEPVDCSQYLP